jgi:pSer/pThr/pTyr-binding forkhead associated (FHA) protein
MGLTVLAEIRADGVVGPASARRLREAGERLEAAKAYGEAATAWEMLGDGEAVVRCLKLAGDVERLERWFDVSDAQQSAERVLRARVDAHDMAMTVGARSEAWAALQEALAAAPNDPGVRDLVRRFEGRRTAETRICVALDGERCWVIGKDSIVLGRTGADLCLRGASVSRRHSELTVGREGLFLADLGSRNGTLLSGVPIATRALVTGEGEVGLGDDVALRVRPDAPRVQARLEVIRGLDLGLRAVIGPSPVALPEARVEVYFEHGFGRVVPNGGELHLNGQRCTAAVEVLRHDVIEVAGRRLEVLE